MGIKKQTKYKIATHLAPFRELKLQGNQVIYISERSKHLQAEMTQGRFTFEEA